MREPTLQYRDEYHADHHTALFVVILVAVMIALGTGYVLGGQAERRQWCDRLNPFERYERRDVCGEGGRG